MDGVSANLIGNTYDTFDIEVRGDAFIAEINGVVCVSGMQRRRIVSGVNGRGPNAQVCGRPEDSYRDFATIGDK